MNFAERAANLLSYLPERVANLLKYFTKLQQHPKGWQLFPGRSAVLSARC